MPSCVLPATQWQSAPATRASLPLPPPELRAEDAEEVEVRVPDEQDAVVRLLHLDAIAALERQSLLPVEGQVHLGVVHQDDLDVLVVRDDERALREHVGADRRD